MKHLTAVGLALALAVTLTTPTHAQPERQEGTVALRPLAGVASVATGLYHACAVLTNGQARCWGRNLDGELGDGSLQSSAIAVTVRNPAGTGPLTGVAAIAVGGHHSCARLRNGQARCWGAGGRGQLGSGAAASSALPLPVHNPAGTIPLTGVAGLSAGANTTCARLTNGQARCWGDNTAAQLGIGNQTVSRVTRPRPVVSPSGRGRLTGVAQIDVGYALACARLANRQARCWGANLEGGVGDGTRAVRSRPVVVRNASGLRTLTRIRQIEVGAHHACAVRTDRTSRCWGDNGTGQLGDGSDVRRLLPVVVVDPDIAHPLRGVADIDAGVEHTCARLTSGQVRCWGLNIDGALGIGTFGGSRSVPVPVMNRTGTTNLTGAAQLDGEGYSPCVRTNAGRVLCWGYGANGQLGNGANDRRSLPVLVITP